MLATDKQLLEKTYFEPVPVSPALLSAARKLRHNMTDTEQFLWKYLRQKQLGGFRFRRQHPFDRFVLDFYCSEARLAVELDGGQHNQENVKEQDESRTRFLSNHGIWVLRFWNNEVFKNVEGVLHIIQNQLAERTAKDFPHPNPPPLGEGV